VDSTTTGNTTLVRNINSYKPPTYCNSTLPIPSLSRIGSFTDFPAFGSVKSNYTPIFASPYTTLGNRYYLVVTKLVICSHPNSLVNIPFFFTLNTTVFPNFQTGSNSLLNYL